MDVYRTASRLFVMLLVSSYCLGCSNPQPGPDKTIAGAVLGAGWGAGAGAVVAHQLDSDVGASTNPTRGEGALVGAGFGMVGGAMSGYGYDRNEDALYTQEKKLASLKIQNMANAEQLKQIQTRLDSVIASALVGGVYQVFFDVDQTNLRSGAIANLEVIANSIKQSPNAFVIHVVGHTDDSGDPEYNQRLAESRASSVSAYLGSSGISMDRIQVSSYGAKRPIASNSTPAGRQLNRRVDVYIGR